MIYIGIPVHDEAATLGPLLWKLRKVFTQLEFRRDFQVVVLDDASAEDMGAVVERYRPHLPLTLIRSEQRLGYGRSVDRILRHVVDDCIYPKRDAAVILQGDFTEDPASVVDVVKTFEGGADIVAGTADAPEGAEEKTHRWARRLAPWILGRTHSRAPVADPFCGLRAYRVVVLKKALRDDAPLCSSQEPWAANLELLARAAPHARRIEDAAAAYHPERRARPTRFRTLRALRSLIPLRGTRWEPVAEGDSP